MTSLSPSARRPILAANLICLASMAIWASGLPAATLILPHMPPVALTAGRATLAALVLVPVWWLLEGRRTVLRADWVTGAWVGFVTLGLASVLIVIALQFNDPVTVAIVSAVMPVIGILLEKRPELRYRDGLDLAEDLKLVADTLRRPTRPASGTAASVQECAPGPAKDQSRPPLPRAGGAQSHR